MVCVDACAAAGAAPKGTSQWAWGSGDALGIEFLKRPPDESADACVSLLIAPSYVTYVPEAVAAVQRFFTTRRTLELATLQLAMHVSTTLPAASQVLTGGKAEVLLFDVFLTLCHQLGICCMHTGEKFRDRGSVLCIKAQAEARAEALRQLASLQLRALGQAALQRDKPKLVLALCAHAPKVA
eukprot:scaffold8914_cov19-Tisochrysis_lutea.AAC.1